MKYKVINEKQALDELKKGYKKAEKILENEDKMERFLQRLEKKLKEVPFVGDKLAMVAVMVSLIKSYYKKEYRDIPIGTVIVIISALIYYLSPLDVIPDGIPGIGMLDDATIVLVAWKLIDTDVKEYEEWRKKNNKMLDI